MSHQSPPSENVTFLPGVEYNGPPQLAEKWDDFTRAQSPSPSLLKAANKLNELAFTDISPKDFLAKHVAADPRTGPHRETANPNYTTLKESLEAIATISAGRNTDEERKWRRLNNTITQNLVDKWIDLEKAFSLYPPARFSRKHGVKNLTAKEVGDIRQRRDELLAAADGGLLASLLYSSTSRIIDLRVTGAARKFQKDEGIIRDIAYDLFQRALFTYEKDKVNAKNGKKSSFKSYLGEGLKKQFNYHIVDEWRKSLRNQGSEDVSDRVDEMQESPDTIAIDSESWAQKQAQHRGIVDQIERLEKPRDRELLARRFGLNGYNPSTQQEVGKALGISKQRVDQIEKELIKTIRSQNGVGDTVAPAKTNGSEANSLHEKRLLRFRKKSENIHSETKR